MPLLIRKGVVSPGVGGGSGILFPKTFVTNSLLDVCTHLSIGLCYFLALCDCESVVVVRSFVRSSFAAVPGGFEIQDVRRGYAYHLVWFLARIQHFHHAYRYFCRIMRLKRRRTGRSEDRYAAPRPNIPSTTTVRDAVAETLCDAIIVSSIFWGQ